MVLMFVPGTMYYVRIGNGYNTFKCIKRLSNGKIMFARYYKNADKYSPYTLRTKPIIDCGTETVNVSSERKIMMSAKAKVE